MNLRKSKTERKFGPFMIMALVISFFIAVLIVRAGYVLYSVGSFKSQWLHESARPVVDDSIVIAALGDSTVQGIGALSKSDGFVSQVSKRVAAKTGKKVQIFNYSVSGADSGEVLKGQIPELKKLARYDAVLVAVGPNDITHKNSLEDFLKNYESILQQLPPEKTVIASLPPMGPKDIKGRSSYDWGQALKPVAAKYNVAVAPVFDHVKPRANDFRIYGGDFYHPSKAGYKLWADAFEAPVLSIVQ